MTYLVYGQAGCRYCQWAVNLLTVKSVKFHYLSLDEDPELKERFLTVMMHETVPQIYVKDAQGVKEHIGGYEQLFDHFKKITH